MANTSDTKDSPIHFTTTELCLPRVVWMQGSAPRVRIKTVGDAIDMIQDDLLEIESAQPLWETAGELLCQADETRASDDIDKGYDALLAALRSFGWLKEQHRRGRDS